MVYCRTESNLWPGGPEDGECPTNKRSAAGLPRGGVSHLKGLGIRDMKLIFVFLKSTRFGLKC